MNVDLTGFLLSQHSGRRLSNTEVRFRCPFPERHEHGDAHPSANYNTAKDVWLCRVCGAKGTGKQLAKLLALSTPKVVKPASNGHRPSLTLEELAQAKGLDADYLAKKLRWQTEVYYDGMAAVAIPYLDENRVVTAKRWRLRLEKSQDGDHRFAWEKGAQLIPYGVHLLAKMRAKAYLLLLEGETDTATCWSWGIPALGIPGVTAWKEAWRTYLDGFARVFAWQEPGNAGQEFIRRLGADIPQLLVIQAPPQAKDPNELFRLMGAGNVESSHGRADGPGQASHCRWPSSYRWQGCPRMAASFGRRSPVWLGR